MDRKIILTLLVLMLLYASYLISEACSDGKNISRNNISTTVVEQNLQDKHFLDSLKAGKMITIGSRKLTKADSLKLVHLYAAKLLTTHELNSKFKNSFFKIKTKGDTIDIGQSHSFDIIIDTLKVTDYSKCSVYFNSSSIERRKNIFRIYFSLFKLKDNRFDITILKHNVKGTDTIKFIHYVYGVMPVKGNEVEYRANVDKLPVFKSEKYKSFNDYLNISFKTNNIKLKGRYAINYIVMKNSTTKLKGIEKCDLDYQELDKIEQIIGGYHDWIPGELKEKKINVLMSDLFYFE